MAPMRRKDVAKKEIEGTPCEIGARTGNKKILFIGVRFFFYEFNVSAL